MINNAPFGALALSSLRLSTGFLLLMGLALLLSATSFWAFSRILYDHEARISSHFARTLENIHEQQKFLIILTGNLHHPNADTVIRPESLARQPLSSSNGMDVYEAAERSFSLPFTLAESPSVTGRSLDIRFNIGWHLANAYSRFWAQSHLQPPQVLLFSPESRVRIAVPALSEWPDQTLFNLRNYVDVSEEIQAQVSADPTSLHDNKVHWVPMTVSLQQHPAERFLGYIGARIPIERLREESGLDALMLVTVFDMQRVHSGEQAPDIPLFDQLRLIGPDGYTVLGEPAEGAVESTGLSLSRAGVLVTQQASTADGQQWTAQYLLGYANFFRWTTWPLIRLLTMMLLISAASWWFYRLYRERVVAPARIAQQQLLESQAFSQAVIDIAPAGLSVIRHRDSTIVLENQRAQAVRTVSEAISRLLHQPDISLSGEACMEVDEHYYFVSYMESRYQDEDVTLCVFNDVTEHKRAYFALHDAKLKADQASEAKSVFLATMSHEIRTPLYGVLGTLELFGLTHLDQRQRDYLHTIQRSSSTLLQLISDILDVSKIEAGQLALESINFSPLDLAEDALNAHVANAEAKGLQIYACIDPQLPDWLYGDQMRIWQILNNLLSNAIKFTDIGRIVLRGRVVKDDLDRVWLEYQVTDTGIGISQEQQLHLFDPFYQVHSNNLAGGTGLGLSICTRFCQLMGGELKVVSEPGLGSSFTATLPLCRATASVPESCDIELNNIPVYVRAPVRELAENISQWLNRWGANARVISTTAQEKFADALLVDVLGSNQNPLNWVGARVICEANGPPLPEFSESGWRVGVHHVRAIALCVQRTQHAALEPGLLAEDTSTPQLGLRILVAEDNPINQGILKEQLEVLGCLVTLASDGQEALKAWDSGSFDMVLTDVNMPLMNGYQLTQALRESGAHIPIIGVTANAMREEGDRCRAAGMTSWMVKPLSLSTLRGELIKINPVAVVSQSPLKNETCAAKRYIPETIVLSTSMRSLFLTTMDKDLASTRRALADHDQQLVREKIHGLCGALAVVQAQQLSAIYAQLEDRLLDQELNASLVKDVDQALEWLASLLASLEASTPSE